MPLPMARPGAVLHAILIGIALAAIAVPALVVRFGPHVVPQHHRVPVRQTERVVPAAELPPVELVQYQDLSPDDARAFNATIPFSSDPNPAARPLVLHDTADNLARAIDCLAVAALYEAGDDPAGERAVVQVVLNRLRHPAFPKTVCGVVFQGAERSTGCQFTFTCDGSLARVPPDPAWQRARDIAAAALAGKVYAPVGYATHYHTDWVVPYWRASLDKIVEVHTQLFYRWTGWWGTPPAFRRQVSPDEPLVPQIAALSAAHRPGDGLTGIDAGLAAGAVTEGGATPTAADPNAFLVTLDPHSSPEGWRALAEQTCGERTYCKFMAWTDRIATPTALPLEPYQVANQAFSYLRDRGAGFEKGLWNCERYKRPDPSQCMKVQLLGAEPSATAPVGVAGPNPAPGPPLLDGVHRRAPVPVATPTAIATPAARATPGAATPIRAAIVQPPVVRTVTPPGTSRPATP